LTENQLPTHFLEFLKTIRGRRSRIVVDHILEHSFITTEDLESKYGYKHPPRAIRDVREQGVPIETFTVKNSEGRSIAAYRFGDVSQARYDRAGGRRKFPKHLKDALYQRQNSKCAVCLESYDKRYLQIDHRIPYQIAGEPEDTDNLKDYMLICGSCNRAKSWSCEHCENVQNYNNPQLCRECYWANPDQYTHIALRSVRRIELIWSEGEMVDYEKLRRLADEQNETLPNYVKDVLKRHLQP
jgi:5-methylcytosine-specific restriction endonuclease McrA